MNLTKIHTAALGALLLAALPAHAELRYFGSAASFDATVQVGGSDLFADLSTDTVVVGPLLRHAGSFDYQLSSNDAGFYVFGNAQGERTVSTEDMLAGLSFSHFGSGVNAFAADLSALNFSGDARANTVLGLSVTDTLGVTSTRRIELSSGSSYLAFVSSAPLASVNFTVLDHGSVYTSYVSPGIAKLSLAQASVSAVPEPSQAGMALAGLMALGALARRRKARAQA